jgi:hypothetical protein
MSDLEGWSKEPGKDYLDDRCYWKKTYLDPKSTTFHDVNEDSDLYKCTLCEEYTLEEQLDFKTKCECYRSDLYWSLKKECRKYDLRFPL